MSKKMHMSNTIRLLQLAIPFCLSGVVSIASAFVCVYFLSQLGTDYLAASALMVTMQAFISTILNGILFSIGIFSSLAYGEKNYALIGDVFQQGVVVSFFLGILAALCLIFAKSYLRWFGQDQHLVNIAQMFFYGYAPSILAILIITCETQILLSLNKANWVLMIMLLLAALNVASAYCFIFGVGFIPRMDALGYGIATSISHWLVLIGLTILLYKNTKMKRYRLFSHFTVNTSKIKDILRTGMPIGMELGIEQFTLITLTFLMGTFSYHTLSAHQVVNQYIFVITVFLYCMSHAVAILIAKYRGDNDQQNILVCSVIAMVINISISIVFTVISYLASNSLVNIFVDEIDANYVNILQIARGIFFLQGLALTADAIRHTSAGILRGYEKTKAAMLLSNISLIFVLSLAMLYNKGYSITYSDLFIVRIVGLFVGGVCLLALCTTAVLSKNRAALA